ncbi:MAG: acyl-[acyl-carrier-protein]--UDP-N-acetylglucosamine O-acyltransferase, partial [Akkermansiaceae bacterium]|nr:acyl-[acyl-carrier-protein]--UDP-N-acetylglucosamine O-acyltransferase [Akkermansiaceae bacterium]
TKIVQDVPPFMIADGNPASLRGLNLVGLQRRGFSEDAVRSLKAAYKALFLKKETNLSTRIEALTAEPAAEQPEVARLLAFLAESERGVVR